MRGPVTWRRRQSMTLALAVLAGVAVTRANAPQAVTPTTASSAVCGTWVLTQVSGVADLRNQRPRIDAALSLPGVVGLSLRVPWKAVDSDFSVFNEGIATARAKGKAFSVRFMAGRHTPSRVFADGSPFYVVEGEKVPTPFLADGSPNLVFERHWEEFVTRLAGWSRTNGVQLLHLAWYGQTWAELNLGWHVRNAPGYSLSSWLTAHRRLVDLAAQHSGPDLAVELPLSGVGPLSHGPAAALADHIVSLAGGGDRFYVQANGWSPNGDWGTYDPAIEADLDGIWKKPVPRGQQAVQPEDYGWARMYEHLYANNASYAEVYLTSFDLPRKDLLAAEMARFHSGRCTDTTAPTAAVTGPAPGSVLTGTVSITVTAADNSRVSELEVLIDGEATGTMTGPVGVVSWDTTTVADGRRVLLARAIDAAGNRGTSPSVEVIVNNVAPAPPAAVAAAPGNQLVTVSFDAVPAPDHSHYEIEVKESSVSAWAPLVATPSTRWTFLDLTNGTSYDLRARSADIAGSASAWSPMVSASPLPGDGVDDVPAAAGEAVSTVEDTPALVPVLGNDAGLGDGGLTVTLERQAARGVATVNADRTITYQPARDTSGDDTFMYRVIDEDGDASVGSVAVQVLPVNDAPEARDDTASTLEDVPVRVDLLGNDTDPDGAVPLAVTIQSSPARGSVAVGADGTVTYSPKANTFGVDGFTYRVHDAEGLSDLGAATVRVLPVDDVPVAVTDAPSTPEDVPVRVAVLVNDSGLGDGGLTVTVESQGALGAATVNPDRTITYQPGPDASGDDTFTYRVVDADGDAATAVVSPRIVPVNDPPVAGADMVTTPEDVPVIIAVLGNDHDSEDPTRLTVTIESVAVRGTVAVNPDRTVTYTPRRNTFGLDTFTYRITDTEGLSAVGAVAVRVEPVDDVPVAVTDSVSAPEATPVRVAVLVNDTGLGDGGLTVTVQTQGALGVATVNPDRTITYQPGPDASGEDTFTYRVVDTDGDVSTAVVSVWIVRGTP